MKPFNFARMRYLCGFLMFFLLEGCTSSIPQKTDTKLYSGTGRYTGEFYVYRVDDAWAPVGRERNRYYIGDSSEDKTKHMRQWVPVREKDNITGLDGPERIATREDLVRVSLRHVFIKYFREIGKGEIALILSFASGEKLREDLLIYASQGQTLGSSLAFDDLTIIGPQKLEGQSIRIRLIMIEIDQIENETMKEFIKNAAGLASIIQPEYATAVKIASDVAQFIVSFNQDDIVFDRTFELSMTQKGESIETTPLLYAQYILLLQEDRFQGLDVKEKAEIATRPPRVSDMRFNLHAGRLFSAYMYRPSERYKTSGSSPSDRAPGDEPEEGVFYFDLGNKRIDFDQFYSWKEDYLWFGDKHANILQKINEPEAADFRHEVLAFPKSDTQISDYRRLMGDRIGDLDLWGGLGETLATVYCESIRYTSKEEKSCEDALRGGGRVFFHFPVYLYPKAYTILAQYPFHTHIVLSISRSIGTRDRAAEERFLTYSKWLEAAREDVRDRDRFTKVLDTIRYGIESQALIDIVLKKALGEKELEKKICIIVNGICNKRVTIKNSLYNELFHLTGEIFQSEEEVKNYIKDKYPTCEIK